MRKNIRTAAGISAAAMAVSWQPAEAGDSASSKESGKDGR